MDATAHATVKQAMETARVARSTAFWELYAVLKGYIRLRRNLSPSKVSRWI